MSGTSPPTTSPQQKNRKFIADNISNMKEKIRNTSKFLKVLTRSKKDCEPKTDENSELKAKILALEEEISFKNEQFTQENNRLRNQVKKVEQEREDLDAKLKKAEAENEELKNLALKIELDEKEEVSDLSSKVEELQRRLKEANKPLADERSEHHLYVQELKSKALKSARNPEKQQSPSTISSVFMNKIKKLKANYINSKNENLFLKEQIKKKDSIIMKSQSLESTLQISSDDDNKYMNVDIAAHSSSNSSHNTARANQLNKINTPPPPQPPKQLSSESFNSFLNESILIFSQTTLWTTKITLAPTPELSPPRAQTPQRTSSVSTKSSSSSAAVRGSMNDPYKINLDACSPTHNSSAPISPTERVANAIASKETPVAYAEGTNAEASSRIISPPTGKAANRTSGLVPPSSQIVMPSSASSAKAKKPKNKLGKFVNSCNASKVIASRHLISNTAAEKQALPPERPVSETPLASRPDYERLIPSASTVKPVVSTPYAAITKSPSLASPPIPSHCKEPAFNQTEILHNDKKTLAENISLDTAIFNLFNELVRIGKETDKATSRIKYLQVLKSLESILYSMDCRGKLHNDFISEKMSPLLSNGNLNEMALETMATLGTFGLSADPTKNNRLGVQQLFELMIHVFAVDNTSIYLFLFLSFDILKIMQFLFKFEFNSYNFS